MENLDNLPQEIRAPQTALRLSDAEAKCKVAGIVARLNTDKAEERQKAERELWDMGEQGFELLLVEIQKIRRTQRRLPYFMAAGILVWMALTICLTFFIKHVSIGGLMPAFITPLLGAMVAMKTRQANATHIRRTLMMCALSESW